MSVLVFDRPSVAERTEAQDRGYGDKERYNSLENAAADTPTPHYWICP